MIANVQESVQINGKQSISQTEAEKPYIDIIGKLFISILSYLAVIFVLLSMSQLNQVSLYALLPGFLIMISKFIIRESKLKKIGFHILTLGVIGIFVIQYRYFMDGWLLSFNQLVDMVGINTGVILTQYKITVDSQYYILALAYFWSYFAILLSFICYYTVQYKKNILFWLCIFPIFTVQIVTGIMPNFYLNILLLMSALLLLIYIFIHQSDKYLFYDNSNNKVFLSISVILLLFFSVVLGIINSIYPISNYSKPSVVDRIADRTSYMMKDFRYEKQKPNNLTQGDFTRLDTLELMEEDALEVIMDKPKSLYLRGFVGSEYTSKRWESLGKETQYNAYNLFYWLRENDFNPLHQLSQVSDLSDAEEQNNVIGMTINNLAANSKYIYTPYELVSNPTQIEDYNVLDNSMFQSSSFFGDRLYSFEFKENLVTEYPRLANKIYQTEGTEETRDYFNNEEHYNAFVYEKYTKLPENIEQLYEKQLEIEIKGEGQHIPYEQAIEFVQSYLKENIEYSIYAKSPEDNHDFLIDLFENSHSGYSTHFATAGTTIFRYLGIPSRYVEGYLLSPQDIEGKDNFEKITIQGTNAHAWTEIYLDQVGWIPIEVTPPYADIMETTDFSDYPSGDTNNQVDNTLDPTTGSGTENTAQVVDQEEFHDPERNQPPEKMSLLERIILLFLILFSIAVLCYILYFLAKRKQLRKIKKMFDNQNYSISIPAIYNYSMLILYYNGLKETGGSAYCNINELKNDYSQAYADDYQEIIKINQKARYSLCDISEDDYTIMKSFVEKTLKEVVSKKNIFQRFKMRFIDFIY